ncbi:Growth arrest-specific protein 1 -like protein [Toxocara canis]|nr:Growth arrest-specific protein 1 -like protein [Toxocara canis]
MSQQCKAASVACEEDTDCVHRLAVLQSTCVTNTCQPQCRNAVLNLYQNRLGRTLLRTDASCIPGRHELELCNLLPSKSPLHCNLAKLACEADMEVSYYCGLT